MKKNWFRYLLHLWIAVGSIAAFISGWVFLGHSGKPVSTSAGATTGSLAPLPTLEPLLPLDNGSTVQRVFPQQSQIPFSRPMFRTRGS